MDGRAWLVHAAATYPIQLAVCFIDSNLWQGVCQQMLPAADRITATLTNFHLVLRCCLLRLLVAAGAEPQHRSGVLAAAEGS
jgi:hypothetical protein